MSMVNEYSACRTGAALIQAGGKIDGINAGDKRMVGLGDSHGRGFPGFMATPRI